MVMAQAPMQRKRGYKLNLRSIALPAEHGAWSLILEPIVLALLLAPTWLGLSFAIAMFAAFLMHQPIKIVVKDYLKNKITDRTKMARRFVLLYAGLAALFALPIVVNSPVSLWIAIALIMPFALIQLYFDFKNQSRSAIAEVSGAIALSGTVSVLAILGGWILSAALTLWLILSLRAVPSILFVRSLFRKQRGKDASLGLVYIIHIVATGLIILLTFLDNLPTLVIIPFLALLGRAIYTLQMKTIVKAKVIGIREVIFGMITILFVVMGYNLNI